MTADRLTEIKARVALWRSMHVSNELLSDLEFTLDEIDRLQWDVEAKDVEWKLQEEMKDKAVAERDALRAEVGRLRAALTEVLEDNDKEVDCAHGISWEVEARARAALEGSK